MGDTLLIDSLFITPGVKILGATGLLLLLLLLFVSVAAVGAWNAFCRVGRTGGLKGFETGLNGVLVVEVLFVSLPLKMLFCCWERRFE